MNRIDRNGITVLVTDEDLDAFLAAKGRKLALAPEVAAALADTNTAEVSAVLDAALQTMATGFVPTFNAFLANRRRAALAELAKSPA